MHDIHIMLLSSFVSVIHCNTVLAHTMCELVSQQYSLHMAETKLMHGQCINDPKYSHMLQNQQQCAQTFNRKISDNDLIHSGSSSGGYTESCQNSSTVPHGRQ